LEAQRTFILTMVVADHLPSDGRSCRLDSPHKTKLVSGMTA
jgi:hypothetical protein